MPSRVPQPPPLDQTQMLHGMAEHLGVAAVLSELSHAVNQGSTSHTTSLILSAFTRHFETAL